MLQKDKTNPDTYTKPTVPSYLALECKILDLCDGINKQI